MRLKSFIVVFIGLSVVAPARAQGRLERILAGRGKVVDLTHRLSAKIPYWPGGQYRPFEFTPIATLDRDGVFSGFFAMPEHMGTHVDAPNHFVAGRPSVDDLLPEQLICPAVVLDVRDRVRDNPDYQLTVEDIRRWERRHGRIPRRSLVLLYTGWGARWGTPKEYLNRDEQGVMHFPGFSPDAARFLVTEREISGLGIDTLSVDYGPSKDFPVHHITHGAGKYHIENVANLDRLPARGAIVIVGVLPIEGGSGGPARVFALLP
ncbi:MAG TPA: cyclase family protein [Blastocatellia bacterium]|nr:cyclase family protein [Blastocatellia bacterium]